jgi:hypothetical protein
MQMEREPMSQEMSTYLHFLLLMQYVATLVLPPAIFGAVLLGFLGVRKLKQVIWG